MTNHQIRSWLLLDPCCLSVGQPCLKKAPHHLSQHISIKLKRNHGINHSFSPQESRKALCTTIIGYVSDTQTDLQSPVQFSLSYSLVQVDASVIPPHQCHHHHHHHHHNHNHKTKQEDPLVFYNTGRPLPLANSRPILNQQQVLALIDLEINTFVLVTTNAKMK